MNIIFLIGRIIFGGFFLLNAWNHLAHSQALAGYAGSKKVPAARLAVIGSGLLVLIGGLGIVLGVYTMWALWAVVVFLIPVTLMMHAYWQESDPQARMMQQIQFRKNLALLGAALMLLSLPTPWPWALF